jgi:hypothetical protein
MGAGENKLAREWPTPPRFLEPLPAPETAGRSRATRYAQLSPAACRTELQRRALPHVRAGSAQGVATPIRVTGALRGVRFIFPGPKVPYGVLDCRLALVLDDWAELLAELRVTTVLVDNAYRPRARLGKKRSQHAYGLAVDVVGIRLADGTELRIERDWMGRIGEPACGPGARIYQASNEHAVATPSAAAGLVDRPLVLREIVCAAARGGFFHRTLTPNFDPPHRDHLHLDIGRDARWIVVE